MQVAAALVAPERQVLHAHRHRVTAVSCVRGRVGMCVSATANMETRRTHPVLVFVRAFLTRRGESVLQGFSRRGWVDGLRVLRAGDLRAVLLLLLLSLHMRAVVQRLCVSSMVKIAIVLCAQRLHGCMSVRAKNGRRGVELCWCCGGLRKLGCARMRAKSAGAHWTGVVSNSSDCRRCVDALQRPTVWPICGTMPDALHGFFSSPGRQALRSKHSLPVFASNGKATR